MCKGFVWLWLNYQHINWCRHGWICWLNQVAIPTFLIVKAVAVISYIHIEIATHWEQMLMLFCYINIMISAPVQLDYSSIWQPTLDHHTCGMSWLGIKHIHFIGFILYFGLPMMIFIIFSFHLCDFSTHYLHDCYCFFPLISLYDNCTTAPMFFQICFQIAGLVFESDFEGICWLAGCRVQLSKGYYHKISKGILL